MAPEYAMEGLYSIKSDVFSFGVLLLDSFSPCTLKCTIENLQNKSRKEKIND